MKTKLFTMMAAAMLFAATASAQEPNPAQNAGGDLSAESTACNFLFTSGAGPSLLQWCVSSHGNMPSLVSPAGFEHIRFGTFLEGYVLCSGTVPLAWDLGDDEFGWGLATVLAGPSASGITIRRISSDGSWQLDQKFTRDNKENDISIVMTVKRLAGPGLADVRLARIFDPDIDGSFVVQEDRSDRGVWARNFHAITLSNITFNQTVDTAYQTSFGAACSPASLVTPRSGDDAAVVTARLGVMGVGNSKNTTFVYRRQ